MKRLLVSVATSLSLLLALTIAVGAQSPLPPGVDVSLSVERDGDTIGDPVLLTVVVTHPSSGELLVPPPEGPLGELEPAAPSVSRTTTTTGDTRVTLIYETRAFNTGPLTLRPQSLSYRSDGVITPIQPADQIIDVRSLLPADGSLVVRGAKPPEAIAAPGFPILPLALAIGLAAALLLTTAVAIRRRRRPLVLEPGAAAPDPADVASGELDGIAAAGLLPHAVDEFCARLNVAVRGYLATRYALPARNLTAAELSARLARAGADAGTVQRVRNLCQACDDIAYAGATPDPTRVERYLDLAQAIIRAPIEASAPAPEHWAPPKPDAAPAGGGG